MKILFFKPENELLKNYIEGYYFLINNENSISYLTFPNNYSIISISENGQIDFEENKVLITYIENKIFTSDIICNYKKPIQVDIIGKYKEITFYFKPLGLNAFLDKNLCNYTNNTFKTFIPFDDFQDAMTSILRNDDIEESKNKIEQYWLSKLIGFEHQFLSIAIEKLQSLDDEISISNLAIECNTSRQNLLKNFDKHLCKSPSDFRKSHRFREALKVHSKDVKAINLTQLSLDLFFYDQSHLIKDFKSLTGMAPKSFFKNLTSFEDKKVNWLFM